jgi:signal transduction histidine kinase
MILNLMPTPLLFIEPGTGRVFFANAAADRMAGGSMPRAQSAEDFARYYPCSDLDGRPIPSDEMPGVRAARGEEVKATLVRWHLPGGEKIVRIESARLPAAHGHAETVVLAFDDVTAMKEVEARLQEAVRVREDFVSIAGHEMKTPLTALQLTIESLTRLCHPPPTESTLPPTGIAPLPLASQPPPIDPQIVVKADSVQRQVRRLIRLVDQLLDVSRIAAGRFKLAVETFDLVALTAAIIARATEERGPGQSTIELVCDGPVVGTWDRLRVDQVITNLIANAVKYGERTAIQVRVGRTEAGVQVAVSDGGIGIEVAQQERIFDRFERAVSDRNVAGLGLGLWIVRQILEAMNGRIRVESQPGRGATFTVDLPAGRARPT